MYRKCVSVLLVTILAGGWGAAQQPIGTLVYGTNFEGLTLGPTLPDPGHPGQDGWFQVAAPPPAFGELQATIGNGGTALREHTSTVNQPGQQTIDSRRVTPPPLNVLPRIVLSVDFYCHTSNTAFLNPYFASLRLEGGPHPGFEILGFGIAAGNGNPKTNGLGIHITTYYPASCNNIVLVPGVGQNLAWDTWHHLVLVADQALDTYISLTIDGATDALTQWPLARSLVSPPCLWARGQLLEQVSAQIIPYEWLDLTGPVPVIQRTDDDVFFDNLRVFVGPGGQTNSAEASLLVNGIGAAPEPGPFLVTVPSGGTLTFSWGGAPAMPYLLAAGALYPRGAVIPCVGSIDIGTPPFYGDLLFVFNGFVPPYNLFFVLGPSGTAQFSTTIPGLPPGPLLAVQGVVAQPSGPCGIVLTAAFQLAVL